jgi:hypothetical protein
VAEPSPAARASRSGPLAATQIACLGEGATVEAVHLANLGRAASFTATADELRVARDYSPRSSMGPTS